MSNWCTWVLLSWLHIGMALLLWFLEILMCRCSWYLDPGRLFRSVCFPALRVLCGCCFLMIRLPSDQLNFTPQACSNRYWLISGFSFWIWTKRYFDAMMTHWLLWVAQLIQPVLSHWTSLNQRVRLMVPRHTPWRAAAPNARATSAPALKAAATRWSDWLAHHEGKLELLENLHGTTHG